MWYLAKQSKEFEIAALHLSSALQPFHRERTISQYYTWHTKYYDIRVNFKQLYCYYILL